MNPRSGSFIGLVLAVAAFGLAAAWWLGSRSSVPAPPAGVRETLTLAAASNYVGSGLVHVALDNGYFTDAGIEVTVLSQTSGKATLDAMFAGKADLAAAADTPLMFAAMAGRPYLIVATIASEITDHGIIARRDHGIASAADLRGKRIGVTAGSSGHFYLDIVKAQYRIPAGPVSALVDLTPETMPAALAAGEVDAIATWSPYLRKAEEAIGANAIRLSDPGNMQYAFSIAGTADYVRAHPEAVRRLLLGLQRAERFVVGHRAEARAIIERATGAGYQPDDLRWANYDLRLSLEQRLLIQLEDASRWATRNGYVSDAVLPNFLRFVYLDAMAAVQPLAMTIIR